jgi:hypothetical protein
VAATVEGVRGFRVGRALVPAAVLFATGLALSALYARTGLGVPCPFRMLTGWDCPLCGSTRLGAAAIHGHLLEAFWFNPVIFIALAGSGLLGALWTVEALGGPEVRLPRRAAARLQRVSPWCWLAAGLGLAVAYTLLRNLS